MGASYTWTFMVALLVIQKIHNFSWLGLCLQGGGKRTLKRLLQMKRVTKSVLVNKFLYDNCSGVSRECERQVRHSFMQ